MAGFSDDRLLRTSGPLSRPPFVDFMRAPRKADSQRTPKASLRHSTCLHFGRGQAAGLATSAKSAPHARPPPPPSRGGYSEYPAEGEATQVACKSCGYAMLGNRVLLEARGHAWGGALHNLADVVQIWRCRPDLGCCFPRSAQIHRTCIHFEQLRAEFSQIRIWAEFRKLVAFWRGGAIVAMYGLERAKAVRRV